jgi:hypothetical protein
VASASAAAARRHDHDAGGVFLSGTDRSFAFSPDGRRLAYVGGDST